MIRELFQQIGRMFAWIVIVAPWEQAIRVRLGNRVRLLSAGIYLRIPFVDRVYRQTIRRRMSVVSPQVLTSRDGRAVTVAAAIGYSIGDLMKLYNTLHDADETLDSTVAARIATYVAAHDFADCQPERIEGSIRQALDFERYGLTGIEFYITNFAAVKTYRMVTGDIRSWSRSSGLNTSQDDSPAGSSGPAR